MGLVRYTAALLAGIAVAAALPAAGEQDGWSLFPPLIAILTAVATGRLALGLATAIVAAAAISMPEAGGWTFPFAVLQRAAVDFVWAPLRESFQLYILAFTASLVGMVRVVVLAGGTQGIAELLARRAQGARSARLAAFLMGMAIFFDDYANTLVVGTTMRPICDGFRVSREKLAYIVDSTAAPVAGLALISTWIGYEVGLFEEVMQELNTGVSGYELFFLALPSRFYCFLSLVLVACTVLMRRDYGPMLTAERRAAATGAVLRPGARPMTGEKSDSLKPPAGVQPHWGIAAVPVGLVIFGVLGGMQWDAWDSPAVQAARGGFFLADGGYWIAAFSNAAGARVMFLASMAGTAAACAIALTRRSPGGGRPLGAARVAAAWLGGIASFRHALVVLLLAWAIKEACQAVGTDAYLVSALGSSLSPGLVPVATFLLAALVAFAIGTSWTTMAILLPSVLPLAYELGGMPVAVLTAAAVLDGAIFGDHCSPISDTTLLSSIAAACDHMDHVRTQILYALTAMVAAAALGYAGSAYLYSSWVGLLLGGLVVGALVRLAGRDPEVTSWP